LSVRGAALVLLDLPGPGVDKDHAEEFCDVAAPHEKGKGKSDRAAGEG
jgi:hypothetical protein